MLVSCSTDYFLIPNLIAKDHRRIEGLKVHFLDELRTRVDGVKFLDKLSKFARKKPSLLFINIDLWRVCLDGVVDVDENEEQCYEHSHPPWNHLRVDQEADPGYSHK